MKSGKITEGDIVFDESGNLAMADGIEELKQGLEFEITTNIKEWYLNPNFGMKWLDDDKGILENKYDENKVLNDARRVIFKREEVKSINSLSCLFEASERKIYIEGDIITEIGNVGLKVGVGT